MNNYPHLETKKTLSLTTKKNINPKLRNNIVTKPFFSFFIIDLLSNACH